jgi:hypothetical protein
MGKSFKKRKKTNHRPKKRPEIKGDVLYWRCPRCGREITHKQFNDAPMNCLCSNERCVGLLDDYQQVWKSE